MGQKSSLYTCLIVEDSSTEREGLRFLLETKQYPMRILEAANGEAALSLLRNETVDLIITDIRMPFVNGLELAYELRQLNNRIRIIICSAYGEFTYAKQAIELNVSGYLLKPVQRKEFYELIDRMLIELQQQNRHDELVRLELEACWHDLMHNCPADEHMRARLQRHGISMDETFPILMLLCSPNAALMDGGRALEEALTDSIDGLWVLDACHAAVLVRSNQLWKRDAIMAAAMQLADTAVSVLGCTPTLFLSQPSNGIYGLAQAFSSLEYMSEWRMVAQGTVHILGESSAEDEVEMLDRLDRLLNEARSALNNEKIDEAYVRLEEFVACMRLVGNMSALYMRYIVLNVIRLILCFGGRELHKDIVDHVQAAHSAAELAELIEQHMQLLLSKRACPNDKDAIDRILRTIHERYMDDLTLEGLASSVYLSPPYVSSLFRKRTGTTMIKYITDFRMQRAAELLQLGKRSITQVAQAVGYDSASYFSSLFKSRYGVSPTQYGKGDRGTQK